MRGREREREIDDEKSILCEENIQYELGGLRLVLNRFGLKQFLVPLFIVFSGVLLKFLECS